MIYIDKYAYISKLNKQDPMYKCIFCILTFGVCLWANSIIVSSAVIIIMGWYTIFKGGIPFLAFIKLMTIPMSFLIIGVLTIGISVSEKQNIFLYYISIFGTNIGITIKGIQNASSLFFKALGMVSCLYYLSLNTPVVDLLQVLRKLKVPKLFIELMGLVYRFIFVLLETMDIMITSQKSRMGYSSFFKSYRSLAILATTLFIRSYKRSNELYTALESRGYDGEINVIESSFETKWKHYFVPTMINLFLIILALFLRYYSGGL
ncbi:MAG: cobalt ECF transporter T component CbiQ [Clostridiales bacterium]